MNKTILLSGTGLLAAAAAFAGYQLVADSRLQQEQVARYENYVAELQAELETFDSQRVQYETELNRLRRELASTQSRSSSLASELELVQAQIDPEVATLEQRIREQVIVELQQANNQAPDRVDLLKQLNTLDPEEIGQLMTLQSQYGAFLRELDVDDQRMDEIVAGLNNVIAERNQLRQDAINELRQNPGRDQARAIRREMRALTGTEAQMESLSYVLTEDELEVYQQVREQQRENGTFQTQTFAIREGTRAGRSGFIGGATTDMIIQDGQGDAPAIQIFRTEPTPQ